MYQFTFSLSDFVQQYWHKQPTIIKGGFEQFVDPISPEEIAGLSMEEEIDSRFVSNLNDKWNAEHGPFDETLFDNLPSSHWQLIVQAANHWHQGVASLAEPFKGLPQWLFDDIMVCYSVEGGGVGPHIDQYDVFIVQGQGKRRWKVGAKDKGQYTENHRTAALRQIEGFDPIIDQVLEPGDILYIPPGFPHEGNTLEPSLSYSVGYRSPKEQELLSNFADFILAHDLGDTHLHAPDTQAQNEHGQIKTQDLNKLESMLKSLLNDRATVEDFMGALLSQSRHQLDIMPLDEPWETEELAAWLQDGGVLHKVSGLRALYHESQPTMAYINGETFKVAAEQTCLVVSLCDTDKIRYDEDYDSASLSLITELVNKGYWYSEE